MPNGAPTIPEQPTIEQPDALERVERTLETRVRAEIAPRVEQAPAAILHTPAPTIPARTPVVQKTPLRDEIEAALADAQLRRIYAALAPNIQSAFRTAAERLAAQIEIAIASGSLDPEDVHEGIVRWLHIIPKVSHWFLVQEAKLKTDAILALVRRS